MKTYGHLRREHSIAQAQRVTFTSVAKAARRDRVPGDGMIPGERRRCEKSSFFSLTVTLSRVTPIPGNADLKNSTRFSMSSHPVLMKSNGQKASEKQFNTGVKYLRRTRASTTPSFKFVGS
jgi:hypothetical protein